ncbi:MAG: uroporphyrinogen decarboxylase family protein [Armatimonadota bacterium]
MLYEPLTRDQLISVIEGKGCAERIPVMLHFWTHAGSFGDRQPRVQEILDRYPMDFHPIGVNLPQIYEAPADAPEYRWVNYSAPVDDTIAAYDAKCAINDWSLLDGILANFPDPYYAGLLPSIPEQDGRYRLGCWWFCFFERHWSLRGMTNALMDYYTNPDEVHRLFRALTDFYLVVIERASKEGNLDGVFTSDDLGTQTGPFFSPEIFREFFKPYYKELIEKAHSLGMHFWLHCCGNVEKFIPDWIEIGLDVLHPIQKYTMDERVIAEKFGKDLTIWAGFDVQQVIPWGTPEDVRREVRFMIDTYFRRDGRLMLTAGNGVNGDCPVESLEALLDEAFTYGTAKVRESLG